VYPYDKQYSKRLKTVETGEHSVAVTFEDGTTETGSIIIGAEGAHSPTRVFLLGPVEAALIHSPVVASVTITTLNREVALALRGLHERNVISFHPNGIFAWMSSKVPEWHH
jgi:2-polyprenyl-6-methoxyphenol hydroxylase-like FAD-dependent oxidoreductase